MSITESQIPPGLIRSAYQYEKNGQLYHVGCDPKSATLRVFAGRPAAAHELTSHFLRTTSNRPEEVAEIIHSALSRTGAAPVGRGVRTFTFIPTSRCNMGCTYCGQIHAPGSVPSAVASSFLERVEAGFRSPNVWHVHVAWFGGEPLLGYRTIIDLSKQIAEMAAQVEKPYSSRMTTNGALLTPDRMQYLVEDALVSRFDITLDGPADVHDRHRPLKAGGTSFDKIVATLSWYRDAELRQPAIVVLRTNVDRHNLPFVGQYLETMSRLGFNDARKFLFEISPIHSWGNDVSSIALPTQDAARHEVGWMELMEHLGLPYGVLPGRPRATTCVATDPHCEVIDNQGNLFSCTEIPLTPQEGSDRLGNIMSLRMLDRRPQGQFDGWDEAVANGHIPCSTCQLRPICRGACPKQWSEGSIPCPTLKLNFDDRVAIFMRRHGYRTVDANSRQVCANGPVCS
jgi:uncharacterized protein